MFTACKTRQQVLESDVLHIGQVLKAGLNVDAMAGILRGEDVVTPRDGGS